MLDTTLGQTQSRARQMTVTCREVNGALRHDYPGDRDVFKRTNETEIELFLIAIETSRNLQETIQIYNDE